MMDIAANLAFFLIEETGSCLNVWKGRMPAAQQRALMGRVIGKGIIVIDGEREIVFNRVSVCFGHDYDDRNLTKWSALMRPTSPPTKADLMAAIGPCGK